MNFQVSDEYIKKQNKRSIYVALLFVLLICIFIVVIIRSDNISDKFISVIGLYLFSEMIISIYKKLKDGRKAYPTFEIDKDTAMVHVKHKKIKISFPLSDVEKLRLQYRSGKLESILLNTRSAQKLTIKGYENIEAMAEIFQQHTPANMIKISRWFHL